MRRCTTCQAQVLETDKFCAQCSKPLNLEISQTQTQLIPKDQSQTSAESSSRPIQPPPPVYRPATNPSQHPVHPPQAFGRPNQLPNTPHASAGAPSNSQSTPVAPSSFPASVPQQMQPQSQLLYQQFSHQQAPPMNQTYQPPASSPQSPLMAMPNYISHQQHSALANSSKPHAPKLNLKYYKRSRRPKSKLRSVLVIIFSLSLLMSATSAYWFFTQTSYKLPVVFAQAGFDCSHITAEDFNQIYGQFLSNSERLRLSFDQNQLNLLKTEIASSQQGIYRCQQQDQDYIFYHRQALLDLISNIVQIGAETNLDWGILCSNQSILGNFSQLIEIDVVALDFAIQSLSSSNQSLTKGHLIEIFKQKKIKYELNFDICQI